MNVETRQTDSDGMMWSSYKDREQIASHEIPFPVTSVGGTTDNQWNRWG